jgi:hypothetical protein
MKRFAFLAAIVFAAVLTAPTIAADTRLAPADAYFGRMKMSILGIRNSLHDLDIRADQAVPDDASHIFDKLVLVEDAIHDWQSKYPHDTWIPRMTYSLAMVYKKLPIDDAQTHMNENIAWLTELYPFNEYAQLPR